MKKRSSGWIWLSGLSFLAMLINIFRGFDKMNNYSTGDYYPYIVKNAYVGGDAYNYIINGNYATAFFVLATLFAILGIGGLILYYLSGLPTQEIPNNIVEPETVASNLSSPSKHENEEAETDSCQEKSAGDTVISEPSRKNWTI